MILKAERSMPRRANGIAPIQVWVPDKKESFF